MVEEYDDRIPPAASDAKKRKDTIPPRTHAVAIDDGFAKGHIFLASLALNMQDTIACITSLKKGLSLGFPVDELQSYTDFFGRIRNHPELDAIKKRFESN